MSVEPITYGQGSYGYRCSACGADDYADGVIHHSCGIGDETPRGPFVDPRPTLIYRVSYPDGTLLLAGAYDEDELRARFGTDVTFEDVTP